MIRPAKLAIALPALLLGLIACSQTHSPPSQTPPAVPSPGAPFPAAPDASPTSSPQPATTGQESYRQLALLGKGWIAAMALSPTGDDVAAAGPTGIFLYDRLSGEPRHFLPTKQTRSLAFSPDGALLASGGLEGEILFWDPEQGQLLRTIRSHGGSVNALAFRSDGQVLVSGGTDEFIRQWAIPSGEELRSFTSLTGDISSLAVSPDGAQIAADGINSVFVWDAASGAIVHRLEGHSERVFSVAFSPDGRWIASGGDDNSILLWQAASGEQIRRLEGHTAWILALAFSPDSSVLASAGDGTIRLWDVASGTLKASLAGDFNNADSLAFSRDGAWLVSSNEEEIRVWDAASGEPAGLIAGHGRGTDRLAFSADGALLASGGWEGQVRMWEVAAKTVQRFSVATAESIVALSFPTTGDGLLVADAQGALTRWDEQSGAFSPVASTELLDDEVVAFSHDGRLLASAGYSQGAGRVSVVEAADGQILWSFEEDAEATSLAFSSDGRLLATGEEYGAVRLWDLTTGQLRRTLSAGSGRVLCVAISPDGGTLAACGDSAILLWNSSSGELLHSLVPEGLGVHALAYRRDGRLLAAGTLVGTIELWDPIAGRLLQTLDGHALDVEQLAFSPDGRLLASSSDDGTLVLWGKP